MPVGQHGGELQPQQSDKSSDYLFVGLSHFIMTIPSITVSSAVYLLSGRRPQIIST